MPFFELSGSGVLIFSSVWKLRGPVQFVLREGDPEGIERPWGSEP